MRRHPTAILLLVLLLVFGGMAIVAPILFRPPGPPNGLVQVRRVSAHMLGDLPSVSVSGSVPACTTLEGATQQVGTTITLTYTTRPDSTIMIGTRPVPVPVCKMLAGLSGGGDYSFGGTTHLNDDLPPDTYIISVNGITTTLRVPE